MITVQNKQSVLAKWFNHPFYVLIYNLDSLREFFCVTNGLVTRMVNHRIMNKNVWIGLLNVSDKHEQLLSISHELLKMIIYGSGYDLSEEELSKCSSKLRNSSIVQIKVLEDAVVFQSERSIL